MRVILAVAACAIFVIILFASGADGVAGRLALGWYTYASETLPKIRYDWGMIGSAALWVALFTIGFHRFCAWLVRASSEGARRWRKRWTVLSVVLIVVMFGAGTAGVGIVHQAMFLRGGEKMYDYPNNYYWEKNPDGARMQCVEIFERAREKRLSASQIMRVEEMMSTTAGYIHNRCVLAGVDGPDGVICALVMYFRDPVKLAEFGVFVAHADSAWVVEGKSPREVISELEKQLKPTK